MRKPGLIILKALVYICAAITVGVLAYIVLHIIINGISGVSWEFLTSDYQSGGGIFPMIVTTVYMIGIALAIAVPIGVFTAIYLTEYAKRGSRLVYLIRLAAESLSGIPSIIFGLFGMLFFVTALKWSWSLLAGAVTVSIMVLPTIIRSTEEALKAVPDAYREGSFGLGAGKLRTVFRIILPSAAPGIITAIILSIGRIVGETAAIMLTAGTVARIPQTVMQSGRTLSVHMYLLAKEGIDFSEAYATACVIIVVILGINALTNFMVRRFNRGGS
ncbi:MAG: phosphate ABC transporter permease PstA [Christensenellales bacterium]|jgi:phosphate transport system permease protein